MAFLNTIVEHIKEKFPQVGSMLNSALGMQNSGNTNSNATNSGTGASNGGSLEQLEELAKSKLGNLFGNS